MNSDNHIRIRFREFSATETGIRIPFSTFSFSEHLLPKKARNFLKKEGISLIEIRNLLYGKYRKKGMLIRIENTEGEMTVFVD